jgi:hypothetical protein
MIAVAAKMALRSVMASIMEKDPASAFRTEHAYGRYA